tara:strand:+ start:2248 stop:4644 length:2397 start_codon:yes stop_codon:yes gene_type:complete
MAKKKDKDIAKAETQKQELPKKRPDDDMKMVSEMAADPNVLGYNDSIIEFKTNPDKAINNPGNLLYYPPSEPNEESEKRAKLIDKIRGVKTVVSKEDLKKNPSVGFKKGGIPKQMEMFEGGDTSIDTSKLDKEAKEKKDARKIQFDNMTKMLTSGKINDLSLKEKENFVELYKLLKKNYSFSEGGLKDEGGEVDEESGNEVPPGSTKEEVRDDIPARLSEGEFVFPADVVRYLGLDFLMKLRQRAKAGLQKMEEMGQMGNSDEATLPDDIPFTIDDLDMEDDPLEMQVGGVVPNPMGNPTAMPNQVTTMNNPNVYNPNIGQMYTPGGVTPYAPATFKSLLPQSSTGQVKTESRKYTKGSQVRFVPFIVGTGQPLNPAQLAQLEADGFTPDTGISPTKKDDKTKTETTKVKPVDTGGDDSGSAKVSSATLSIGGDKDPNRPGLQTGATTFDLRYNVPGQLPGILGLASLPGIIGGKAPKGTTVDFTKGNITKTVSFADFMKIKNDVTGDFAKKFTERMNTLDKLNKDQIVFDPKVGYTDKTTGNPVSYEDITDPKTGLGKEIADRITKETKEKSLLGFDISKSAEDAYNDLSKSEKEAYNDYATEQMEQEETKDRGTVTAVSLGKIASDIEDDTAFEISEERAKADRMAARARADEIAAQAMSDDSDSGTVVDPTQGQDLSRTFADDAASSGGGGDKIVCTAMNNSYGFGSFRQAIWLSHSKNMHPAYQKGYHRIFKPLIKLAYKNDAWYNKLLKNTLEGIARRRTADIWLQKHGKRHIRGSIERAILEPICYIIGRIK